MNALSNEHISMRKLAKLIGVDAATISRIINGKLKPRKEILYEIADVLNLNPGALFLAAGYESKEMNDFYLAVEGVLQLLLITVGIDWEGVTKQIEDRLLYYHKEALTEEGERKIKTELKVKLHIINGQGPFIEKIKHYHSMYLEGNLTPKGKEIVGSGLLYLISDSDIIPDNLFPVGFIDDAMVIQMIDKQLAQLDGC